MSRNSSGYNRNQQERSSTSRVYSQSAGRRYDEIDVVKEPNKNSINGAKIRFKIDDDIGSTPKRWEHHITRGVQVKEFDIGQPCTECDVCKEGYEPHNWRKTCKNCKCSRDGHEVVAEHGAQSRLGFVNRDSLEAKELGYTFVPLGLTSARQVEQYYSTLPSEEVPKLGSKGESIRTQRIVKQLPKQDLALSACKFVEPEHATSYEDFVSGRNQLALDVAVAKPTPPNGGTCTHCDRRITLPQVPIVIIAPRLGSMLWHPACFKCTECDDLLVDLAYCIYEDKIYCERHYAEKMKPRCAGCDELIFSGEYVKAVNKDWHAQHFCCWQCDESLTGQRYVLRDDHPYCVSCYESVFANACEKCGRTIGIDSKDLSYKDKHWHEACFLCTTCGDSLVDKQFGSKGDRIYCGLCYDKQFASRCDGCHEIFRAGTKKMEYKTRQWHEKCFCCCMCKTPIGTQSFIPREQEIYCAKCYEEKYATRCIKCNKVITSGGVTYKNEPWHRECFTCTHCTKSLAGERFTSRDEKPYCADCFGELFAKRCFACNKPITGIGGTKFISFEDRHWHNDCFFCASCRSSLVGRGFITDNDDIICPECAKQKLM
ncbi:prickle planar cell polarity protein 3-B-like isoform X3 [Anthonomus grandis grandis]|uniref:prickle planar cell polarity protein 3-B-like isoform X3 n=1 Tax=Anthonomus grandis grandis TaxID=2921223 RepID=UPI0021662993|nr:prickle planar cell polarity protein 3-B-like isoform X3 [Anthonomus grandis grandis]